MKINAPVLFDANILIDFKGKLQFLFGFFENVIIHETVKSEVIDETLKNELERLSADFKITYVKDQFPDDQIGKILFEECDKELKEAFDIENKEDLGEYKTLLYAKFNNVKIISSQDTTVWTFITSSEYFKGLECITIQDFAYLIYLNGTSAEDRKIAKSLYNKYARVEHSFDCFKKHMERHGNVIPDYINFENNRITQFEELVNGYVDYYNDPISSSILYLENVIVNLAQHNLGTCLNCLYSRLDKNCVDYSVRKCQFGYELGNEECNNTREEFDKKIRNRTKE